MTTRTTLNTTSATYGQAEAANEGRLTAAARYNQGTSDRDAAMRRAEQAALVTVPSLFPKQGTKDSTTLVTPWQSVGADGLLSLSAKMTLAAFPPGQPFFRQQLSNKALQELEAKFPKDSDEYKKARTEFDKALAQQDQAVVDDLEANLFRPVMHEAMKQLLVAGNFLLDSSDPDGAIVIHMLDKYVVFRDLRGKVVDFVLKQECDKNTLPADLKLVYDAFATDDEKKQKDVAVYTWVSRSPKSPKLYDVRVEMCGQPLPDYNATWKAETMGMWPVAINRIPGQHYGRGHVEMYLGDLLALDGLSQSMVEGIASISRLVTLVDEGSTTDIKELSEANNGDYIHGRKDDVHVVQSEKATDFQVARAGIQDITKRLDKAFINASAVQRDAERVTAEEIRLLAQELDNSFGGTYSLVTAEVQAPLARRRIQQMQSRGELVKLPKDSVKTMIVAGLAALGRTSDFEKLRAVFISANQMIPPNSPVAEYTNIGDLLTRLSVDGGVDPDVLFKSEEDVQQNRQQAAQQSLLEKSAPAIVKGQADMNKHTTPGAESAPSA